MVRSATFGVHLRRLPLYHLAREALRAPFGCSEVVCSATSSFNEQTRTQTREFISQ
jgi:hypothetical protein